MLEKWISRWNDSAFKDDLRQMVSRGITSPELGWFLLPLANELDSLVMLTYTGQRLNLIFPDPAALRVEDICHHLALENRFNGATVEPYSVAQHSVWCLNVFREKTLGTAPAAHEFTMLWHDAPEAYLKDFPRNLKKIFKFFYLLLEERMWDAMRQRWPFLLPGKTDLMEVVDKLSAATEQRDLFIEPRQWGSNPQKPKHPVRIIPLGWPEAKNRMRRESDLLLEKLT